MNTENVACAVVNAILSELVLKEYLIPAWYDKESSNHILIVEDNLVAKIKSILDEME